MDNKLIEITKEQAMKLPELTMYLVYNPLTDTYKSEISNPKDIVHNKYCYEKLKFYLINDGENFRNEQKEKIKHIKEATKIFPDMLNDVNFTTKVMDYLEK